MSNTYLVSIVSDDYITGVSEDDENTSVDIDIWNATSIVVTDARIFTDFYDEHLGINYENPTPLQFFATDTDELLHNQYFLSNDTQPAGNIVISTDDQTYEYMIQYIELRYSSEGTYYSIQAVNIDDGAELPYAFIERTSSGGYELDLAGSKFALDDFSVYYIILRLDGGSSSSAASLSSAEDNLCISIQKQHQLDRLNGTSSGRPAPR